MSITEYQERKRKRKRREN